VGVVILCRLNSSRLPGKALTKINGKVVLEYILERCLQVFNKDEIVIATSDEYTDDLIEEFADKMEIKCFRGSLENVAERFYNAAEALDLDYAVRINGDNIFVDIPLLSEIKTLSNSGNYDFISNVKNRTYPKGMSVESVRLIHYFSLLEKINKSEFYKEHVTSFLYENEKDSYHFVYNTELSEAAGIQMALDDADDLERTTKIVSQFKRSHIYYNLKEIYSIYRKIKS
jgi:spore coat polysaccharide biosynthesis protein SpsF